MTPILDEEMGIGIVPQYERKKPMTHLVDILHKKAQWLGKDAQVKTMNIGQSQVPGYARQELRAFKEIIDRPKNQKSSALFLNTTDVQSTQTEVSVDWESFALTKTTLDHQATLALLKKYLSLVKAVTGRSS